MKDTLFLFLMFAVVCAAGYFVGRQTVLQDPHFDIQVHFGK